MNFKRVRKGYDPVQVEAFIKSREEQNNSIIENQQKIIDAQADEIKQLRQGKETATVGGAMLMDESRRAAVLKKCDIFSRTVDLFEKLVKSRLTEKEAENLQGMVGQNILHARRGRRCRGRRGDGRVKRRGQGLSRRNGRKTPVGV